MLLNRQFLIPPGPTCHAGIGGEKPGGGAMGGKPVPGGGPNGGGSK
ncbi:hypothetical protein ACQKE5_04405 [Paenisporosarcina sp. NPDC076898]